MEQVDVRKVLFALMLEQPEFGPVTAPMNDAELEMKASVEGRLTNIALC